MNPMNERARGQSEGARFGMMRMAVLLVMLLAQVCAAEGAEPAASNPWPAIRKARIEKLLPQAVQRSGVDAWLVVCRENHNDPLAIMVGGENTGGARSDRPPSGGQLRVLRPWQTFAFDGFFSWPMERNSVKGTKTISVEEMAVITEDGAQCLIPPQEELVPLPSKRH